MTATPLLRQSLLTAALALLLAACSDTVEPNDLVGTYHATELHGEEEGIPRDLLAEGGSLTITLAANGTTTGTLLQPGGGEQGEDLNISMAGTWTYDDETGVIAFDQAADSYVPDATWTVEGDTIEGIYESDDDNFVITVLERQ